MRQYVACVDEYSPVSAVSAGTQKVCLLFTGTDLAQFTWLVVETRGYLHVNDLGLLKATRRSPQQTHMHSCGLVYILQHFDMPHSHSLCGSVVTRVTVLVRVCGYWIRFYNTIFEVARMNTVARLLGFGVVRGDTCCGQDTPPVEVPDSVTITCPYQEKPRALELPSFSFICLFAIEDTCGPSIFQV